MGTRIASREFVTVRHMTRKMSVLAPGLVLLAMARGGRALPPDGGDRDGMLRPRAWKASAGVGAAAMAPGGSGLGVMFDAAVRPWEQHGAGARVDGTFSGGLLDSGERHETWLATAGYSYQWETGRSGLTGSSVELLVGPCVGMSQRSWSEGLCFNWFGEGCPSTRPRGFEAYDRVVVGVGGAVSPSVHFWYLTLGVYVAGAAGVTDRNGVAQLVGGVRLGLSDLGR